MPRAAPDYANYVRFFERAAYDWLGAGACGELLRTRGLLLGVEALDGLKYAEPALLGDACEVRGACIGLQGGVLSLRLKLVRAARSKQHAAHAAHAAPAQQTDSPLQGLADLTLTLRQVRASDGKELCSCGRLELGFRGAAHLLPTYLPPTHLLRTTCHLPPAPCPLPPATCHLPPAPYHLPPATCPLATHQRPRR